MSGPFKMKGWSPFTKKSPAKHGDGSWGGTEEAPVVEGVMEEKARRKQEGPVYKPLNREDYPFNTDEEFAKIEAEHKAKFKVE
jgi:hypothetical protein